jgi:hypothetical protein
MKILKCDNCSRDMFVEEHDLNMLHFCDPCLDNEPDKCELVRSTHGIRQRSEGTVSHR